MMNLDKRLMLIEEFEVVVDNELREVEWDLYIRLDSYKLDEDALSTYENQLRIVKEFLEKLKEVYVEEFMLQVVLDSQKRLSEKLVVRINKEILDVVNTKMVILELLGV